MDDRGQAVLQRVGARVKQLRKEAGHAAKEMAMRSGLSARFYAQLEAGTANIALSRLAAVAAALGTPLEDLVSGGAGAKAIALLGLRGGGKSAIGPLLAEVLGLEFVELDEQIEARAGLDLAEIFVLHGESYYRRLEMQCVATALDKPQPFVVALSGGIVHNTEAFDRIRRECTTVWIKARPEDHMQRVIDQGDHRPMAERKNAMAELRTLLKNRKPFYQQAQLTIDTSKLAVAEAVTELQATLTDFGWQPRRHQQ
ncbi:MAG: shikimate kinase [Planctomycetota bacterium]|jgi:XRE family aerobic/anaerobic benzoate catabolism transcriptional regulator|nr:shikimate kinase [Planctomycetota bacterium]